MEFIQDGFKEESSCVTLNTANTHVQVLNTNTEYKHIHSVCVRKKSTDMHACISTHTDTERKRERERDKDRRS